MSTARALEPPFPIKLANGAFIVFWLVLAAFSLFWVLVMSFKLPVDALSSNPLTVIFGPSTQNDVGGLGLIDIALGVVFFIAGYKLVESQTGRLARMLSLFGQIWLGWLLAAAVVLLAILVLASVVLPAVAGAFDWLLGGMPGLGWLVEPFIGATVQHYVAVWYDNAFYRNFINSMIVTGGVVTISLTIGTLAGYALARTGSNLAFWLLITALIFRALPHSVLVTGYLPPFIQSREILMPLWESPFLGWFFRLFSSEPPTLYGQPLAVIAVLVSINQPFTIWMLRSFFQNIPSELDEAARVDGCSHFEAFRRVIMPVMWPGVITTGLFSFLLAYNDYLVCALLLDAQSQTMVPAITQYFNRETTSSDTLEAIAAAVSITAPLFLLVMVFQRQIVSGLTAGAVKG